DVVLQGPRQDSFAEFGDLLVVADHDRVLADQVDAADVAVEIDPHARPVQSRGYLLDVGGFAGAVIAGDDDAAVAGEAGQDGKRGGPVEAVAGNDVRDVLVGLRIGRNLQIAIDAKYLPDRHLHVGHASDGLSCSRHNSSTPAEPSEARIG